MTFDKNTNASFINKNSMVSQELEYALRDFTAEYGKAVYLDLNWLETQLKKRNIDEVEIYRLMILVNVKGFDVLIHNEDNILHTELEVFIVNACNCTGLLRPLILQLINTIFLTLNKSLGIDEDGFLSISSMDSPKLNVPFTCYKQEIMTLKNKYLLNQLDDEFYSLLADVYKIGLPKAYYIHGKMQCDVGDVDSQKKGLEDIGIAADMGDPEAIRYLGRYYHNKGPLYWKKSYEYYTSLGSAMLNNEDKENFIDIKNHTTFNKKLLFLGTIVFFVSVLMFCFIPNIGIYSGHNTLGIICLIAEFVFMISSFWSYKINPLGNQYVYIVYMFVIWMLFMVVKVGI